MSKCILCGSAENLTEEHIFPDALGGCVVLANGTCATCNSTASTQFEAEFINGFAIVRQLLGIENREGKVPSLKATVEIEGQAHVATIKPEGKIEIPPMKIERQDEAGRKEIIYRTFKKGDAEKIIEKAKSKGIELENAPIADLAREVDAVVHVSLDFIGRQSGLRTAAKAAYAALALKTGVGYALSGTFDTVRNYCRNGGTPTPARLFLNDNFQASFHIGPHQHAIVCAGDAKTKRTHALVIYFGNLFYYVRVSDTYEGADFNWTMACDAQRDEEVKFIVGEYDNEFLMLEDIASGNTHWDDIKASGDYLMRNFSKALGLKFE
ncbi:MAG: HNH endonuclease [Acidobacteriia bacterium]|nr:HNH endonuclease [Terriglobia bacterium]